MVDHFAEFGIRNPGANLDGVPMLFVHVISRTDLLVTVTQIECNVRLAL